MSESSIFLGDGCSGTETLGTDAVSEINLGYFVGLDATTVDGAVNSNVNVGWFKGGVSGVFVDFGAGMARLRSVAICFYCILCITPKLK